MVSFSPKTRKFKCELSLSTEILQWGLMMLTDWKLLIPPNCNSKLTSNTEIYVVYFPIQCGGM